MTDTTDLDAGEAGRITFLRSTTTTRVETNASGDTEISVTHVARFAAPEGVIPDQVHRYGSQPFAPLFVTARWVDGKLDEIKATGPRRLKSGKVQQPGEMRHAESREQEWRGRSMNPDATDAELTSSYDVRLPRVIADRLASYEMAVAVASSHPAPGAHR
ncbi:hypothetical protein I5G63_gp054 [Mycobacterium phage Imvubu]|uniref:Uncharacterized protein n=1 Tax=Mycobacterium phage Imvubu TaxID=2686233 RepID=A0A6B9LFV5_9CAUD|nr:hypothetical protein I5G63_gp054 [Mycobacterium phage Imvubu]QHB37795.1 hypothetical protein PBI_IMVUBU_54 [Mycobacterium phage Imvubu]